MALTQISTGGIKDDAVTDAKLPANSVGNSEMKDDAVGVAELSASGTASSSTFLRGDNSWQAISTTPEGTSVLSTGETGTAKFLRVDGDNSCSWQVPPDTNTQLSTEEVQDIVGAMFTGNTETNITATYQDSDGTIDLVSTDTNTQLSTEQVQDIVGAMFTGNTETNITATYEDSDGTIDLVASAGVGGATGVDFNDDVKARFGTGNDLQIYHNGSTSIIDSTTANLDIQSSGAINIKPADAAGITAFNGGAVELYYDNALKLLTTASGAEVKHTSGEAILKVTSYEGNAANLWLTADDGDDWTDITRLQQGTNGAFSVQNLTASSTWENMIVAAANGSVELYHNNTKKIWTESWGINIDGNLALGDSEELIFGGSDDFKLYHDGSNSYIKNDTGWLNIPVNGGGVSIANTDFSENIARFLRNGACELYHDGSKKLETTSAGGTLTGTWSGAGKVLQVVSTHKNDVFTVSASTGSYSDITGLSVTITPSSSSNKVLVLLNTNFSTTSVNQRGGFRLQRGTTTIGAGNAQSNSIEALNSAFCIRENDSDAKMLSTTFLDSPSTTSATTYKLQVGAESSAGTIVINRCGAESNSNTYYEGASNITVMEIAA